MKKTSLLILIPLLALLSGCQILKSLIKTPEIKLKNAVLLSTTLFQGDLEFTFNVSNANPVAFKVDAITYQLVVDGKKTLEGILEKSIDLPAMGGADITIPVTVNYMETLDTLMALFKKDTLTYELSGTVKIGQFTVPFTHTDVIHIPKPPTVQVKGVNIVSMTFTGARLSLELEISSQTPTRLDMKKVTYRVVLGGMKLLDGKRENVVIPADKETQIIEIPVTVDFMTLGKSAMGLLTQGSIDYELTGDMEFDIPKVGLKNIPFKKTGNTGLSR